MVVVVVVVVCLIIVSTPGPHFVKVKARSSQVGDEVGQGQGQELTTFTSPVYLVTIVTIMTMVPLDCMIIVSL